MAIEYYHVKQEPMWDLGRLKHIYVSSKPSLVTRRYYATHFADTGPNSLDKSPQPLSDLKLKSQSPPCKCPVGYFHPEERVCEICKKSPDALLDYAAILLDIPVLETYTQEMLDFCAEIIREYQEQDPGASRLIFADLLDELGYQEGELIRVQEELKEVDARHQKLLDEKSRLRQDLGLERRPAPYDSSGSGILFDYSSNYLIANRGRVVMQVDRKLKPGDSIVGVGMIISGPDEDGFAQVDLNPFN